MRPAKIILILLTVMAELRAAHRLHRHDLQTPVPLQPGSVLVLGLQGAWDDWDNPHRGTRKLALRLRERQLPGVYVETGGNHDRRMLLRFVREALDRDGDRRISAAEAQAVGVVIYGQSWGGAAALKLARELGRLKVPVLLTVQVDSVGLHDGEIPANVERALNLYQRDPGPIRGRAWIRAEDPARTRIAGNEQYSYLGREVDMSDYPAIARRMAISHFKMDNDPAVWQRVERAVLEAIAGFQARR